MKTIFDFDPTPQELDAVGFNHFSTFLSLGKLGDLTPEYYKENIKEEDAIFDIAILHETCGLDASTWWQKIPKRHMEWQLGHDYLQIPE